MGKSSLLIPHSRQLRESCLCNLSDGAAAPGSPGANAVGCPVGAYNGSAEP